MMFKVLIVAFMAVGIGILADADGQEKIRSDIAGMCEMNNATDKTEDALKSYSNGINCVAIIVDPMTNEYEQALADANLNNFFKKYCAKIPDFNVCLNNLVNGLKPCDSDDYTGAIAEVRKALDLILEFVCDEDGEKVINFIVKSGPQCLSEKREKIKECLKPMMESLNSIEDFNKINRDEQCSKYDTMSDCVVLALKECKSPTPAITIEELFKFIRKSSCPPKSE